MSKHIDASVIPASSEMSERLAAHAAAPRDMLNALLGEYTLSIEYTQSLIMDDDTALAKGSLAGKNNKIRQAELIRLQTLQCDVRTRLSASDPLKVRLAELLSKDDFMSNAIGFEMQSNFSMLKGDMLIVYKDTRSDRITKFCLVRLAAETAKNLHTAIGNVIADSSPETPNTRILRTRRTKRVFSGTVKNNGPFTPENPVRLTGNRLKLMEAIINIDDEFTSKDLAERTKIKITTVTPAVSALKQSGYLSSMPVDRFFVYAITDEGETAYLKAISTK